MGVFVVKSRFPFTESGEGATENAAKNFSQSDRNCKWGGRKTGQEKIFAIASFIFFYLNISPPFFLASLFHLEHDTGPFSNAVIVFVYSLCMLLVVVWQFGASLFFLKRVI